MTEIVKVQVPVAGNGSALIYDKARKHMAQRKLMSHEKILMGNALKAYFYGAWSSVVGWGLSSRAPDQEW